MRETHAETNSRHPIDTTRHACQCWAGVSVDNLRCEYRKDPLGIDATRPRLSWILQSDDRGQKQTAYQVLTAATPEALAKDQGDFWDSGRVASDQSIQLEYAGKPLTSRMRCHWKVRVWDRERPTFSVEQAGDVDHGAARSRGLASPLDRGRSGPARARRKSSG